MSMVIPMLLKIFFLRYFVIDSSDSVLFQFGDSLSDTGNAFLCLDELQDSPYGRTYFGHPTGRISDGRLIIDFIATNLGIPLLEPYCKKTGANTIHGVNFATNGATALEYDFFKGHNLSRGLENTFPLNLQFEMFLQFRESRYKSFLPEKAIYIVGEIGGNDYKTMISNKLPTSHIHSLVPVVIGRIEKHIMDLYKAGARRFIVINIPNQGCNPRWLAQASSSDARDKSGCLVWLNKVNDHHNMLLKSMTQRMTGVLQGASISYADFAGVHHEVLRNPLAHGFLEPLVACCGIYTNTTILNCSSETCCSDPWSFVYWNDNHFTDHFYNVVADAFMTPSSRFMDPPFDW